MSGGNSLIFGAFSSPNRMRNRHSFENDRKAADHLRRCCRIARPNISLRSKGELSKRVSLARPHQQTMLGNLNIAIYLFLDRCRTPSRHPQQRAILPFRRIEANPGLPAAQTSLRGRHWYAVIVDQHSQQVPEGYLGTIDSDNEATRASDGADHYSIHGFLEYARGLQK